MGGTWAISPVNDGSSRSTIAWLTGEGSPSRTTVPAASYVSVTIPRRMRAR